MKKAICLAITAFCVSCKKDATTETSNNTHTIYYEATIESEGKAAFSAVGYDQFKEGAATPTFKVIPSVDSKHWVSDTMKFTVESPNLFVYSQFVVGGTSDSEGILTVKTFIDGKEAKITKDTGTVTQASNEFKYSFE